MCFVKNRGAAIVKEYSFVPKSWIVGSYVFWPKTNATKLREDASSYPDLNNWFKYKAIVKRDDIPSLQDAYLIEDQYLNTFTTDAELETRLVSVKLRNYQKINKICVQYFQ